MTLRPRFPASLPPICFRRFRRVPPIRLSTRRELELMPFSARLVTFTIGLRFLTDFLAGDVYFKTSRPTSNLDRARVQFKMVAEMEHRESEMAVR